MTSKVDVAVVGAGVAGSYLAALLDRAGYRVRVYDANPKWRGHFCAWASYEDELDDLLHKVWLHADNYYISSINTLVLNGVEIELRRPPVIIDKPRLVRDLWSGKIVKKRIRSFERVKAETVVNATGIPLSSSQFVFLGAKQWLVEMKEGGIENGALVYIDKRFRGYAWLFPAREGKFHLGAASPDTSPENLMHLLVEFYDLALKPICRCGDTLYVVDPHIGLRFDLSKGKVISVGEAAGAVHPISGEGIIPSLISAEKLYRALIDERVGFYPTAWISYLRDEGYEEASKTYLHEGRRFWMKALRTIQKRGRNRPKLTPLKTLRALWRILR